jgi:hypothetical protein
MRYTGSVLHRTEDCHQLNNARDSKATTVDEARDDMTLCRSVDCWPAGGGQKSPLSYRCPYCGDSVGKLRTHFPCPSQPEDAVPDGGER